MNAIEAGIEAAETPNQALEAGVVTLYDALLGDLGTGFFEQQRIDGQQFEIPEDQWHQVCQWLLDRGRHLDPIGAVNLGLSFMNIGPSSYKETP